jgi:hypothetical protein
MMQPEQLHLIRQWVEKAEDTFRVARTMRATMQRALSRTMEDTEGK